MDTRRKIIQLLGASPLASSLVAGMWSSNASAQLNGNAFIVSGFPAGGMGDMVSRPLAERLRGKYAANVLTESRPGAGGRIAVEHVKRAAPDGLTMLQIPSSPMVLYPHTYKKLAYDPVADFVPVTSMVSYAFSFTAGPGLPAEIKTVKDFLDWAKANPKLANYGVPAAGSALHFCGMMLEKSSSVDLKSVAYKGGAPLLQDVLGGQIPVSFNVLGEVLPHIRSGRLRCLAMTTPTRNPFLPDTPTMAELGYKEIAMLENLGLYLPAKTPLETVRRLNSLVREALSAPDFVESLSRAGLQAIHQSPEDFSAQLREDTRKWAAIAKATGFTSED